MDAYPTASGGGVKFFYRGLYPIQEHLSLQITLHCYTVIHKTYLSNPMRLVLILFLFLAACTSSENKILSKSYFDLTGLLNQQISILSAKRPLVEKAVVLEEKQERIETKDIDWNKELELFLQADLNKQSYQLAYTIDIKDKKANYVLKEGEKMPVKLLSIAFDDKDFPKYIEVLMNTNNFLYESDKKLTLELINNQLKSYKIEGYQQLFIGSKKSFSIEGNIKGDY